MKIIFLDIDGPMIPSYCYLLYGNYASLNRSFSPISVGLINLLCRLDDEIKIVFNTSHNVDEQFMLKAAIREGIVAATIHTDYMTKFPLRTLNRKEAVLEWLDEHVNITHWCYFDDANYIDHPNHILVNFDEGINAKHFEIAEKLLDIKEKELF